MQSPEQLKRSLRDCQAMLDAYDGDSTKVRKILRDQIEEIKAKLKKLGVSDTQTNA